MEKMELCISYINTLYETKPITESFADLIDSIRGIYDDWTKSVEEIRQLNAKKNDSYITKKEKEEIDERIKIIKRNLPAIIPSAIISTRDGNIKPEDKIIKLTGLLHVDIDNYQGDLNELKNRLAGDKYIYLAFISPSGRGIKIFTRVQYNNEGVKNQIDEFHLYINEFIAYIESKYNVTCDKSARDITRLCFLSYDKDLIYNANSDYFTFDINYNEIIDTKKIGAIEPIKNSSEVLHYIYEQIASKRGAFIEGNRNNFTFYFAIETALAGIDKNEAINYIPEGNSFTKREIQKTFDNAYNIVENNGDIGQYSKYYNNEVSGKKKISKTIATNIKDNDKTDFFINVLNDYNLYKTYINNKVYGVHIKDNNIIKLIDIPDTIEYLASILNDMDISKKVGDFSKKDDKSLLCFLQTKEITFLKNTPTSLYFCFLNCIVNITDNGAKVIDYKDLPANVYVNEDDIIKHNYKNIKLTSDLQEIDNYYKDFNFYKFHRDISGDRFEDLYYAIGFMLFNADIPDLRKILFITDERSLMSKDDDKAGGVGKSLLINSISKFYNYNKDYQTNAVVIKTAKNWDIDDPFAFTGVNIFTKLIAIEDIAKKFKFEKLYNVATEGIAINEKYKKVFNLSVEKGYRVAITTNFIEPDPDESSERRRLLLVLKNEFNSKYTPYTKYNENFFSDWNEEQWNIFYNLYLCYSLYFMQNKKRAIGRGYEIYQNAADIYEWFDSSEIEGYLKEGILIKSLRDMYNKAVETNINANKFSKQLKWSIKYKYNLTDTELEACITNHSGNQFVKIS